MNLNNITTALKTGITIYQYEQWQNTGSVNLMQKESHILSKVWLKTNIHNPDSLDKSFIQDKDQAEEMITQYICYYNAIKRWESNHKETEILHQLEISNLLEQLKNN